MERSARSLLGKYHPDKRKSEAASKLFELIEEARRVLLDPKKRKK
jgi:DnaJ-class molecular chaperone